MGGKNHQPCGRYLANSTMMSKYMSLAFAHLEMANVALEDLILAEIDSKTGDLDSILAQLSQSTAALGLMSDAASNLRGQMEIEDFVDLPTMKNTNLVMLGERFYNQGLHASPDA